ncbi:MAG: YggS family pyridoxal phosphate-dependent enzyme [Bdellovibrio sp.]
MTNLQQLQQQCQPAQILAVSKLQSAEKIRELYSKGQRHFGENYVQEALDKIKELQDLKDIQWHFIGHLQTNKIKHILGSFSLIHSVDSLRLAEQLSRHCQDKGVQQRILLQMNLAREESKGGLSRAELENKWDLLKALPGLQICGLMTMPPLTESGEEVRPYFRELREQLQRLREKTDLTQHPLQELSMGTSHDFAVAIEESATIVRLGTILFGERPGKRLG